MAPANTNPPAAGSQHIGVGSGKLTAVQNILQWSLAIYSFWFEYFAPDVSFDVMNFFLTLPNVNRAAGAFLLKRVGSEGLCLSK